MEKEFQWISIVVIIMVICVSFIGQYIIATECRKSYRMIMPVLSVFFNILKLAYDIFNRNLEPRGFYIVCGFISIIYCLIGLYGENMYKLRQQLKK